MVVYVVLYRQARRVHVHSVYRFREAAERAVDQLGSESWLEESSYYRYPNAQTAAA